MTKPNFPIWMAGMNLIEFSTSVGLFLYVIPFTSCQDDMRIFQDSCSRRKGKYLGASVFANDASSLHVASIRFVSARYSKKLNAILLKIK